MIRRIVQAKVLRLSAVTIHELVEVAVVGFGKGPPNLDQFRLGKLLSSVERRQLRLKVVGLAQRQQGLIVLGREGKALAKRFFRP
jgi:hypothetical protein